MVNSWVVPISPAGGGAEWWNELKWHFRALLRHSNLVYIILAQFRKKWNIEHVLEYYDGKNWNYYDTWTAIRTVWCNEKNVFKKGRFFNNDFVVKIYRKTNGPSKNTVIIESIRSLIWRKTSTENVWSFEPEMNGLRQYLTLKHLNTACSDPNEFWKIAWVDFKILRRFSSGGLLKILSST